MPTFTFQTGDAFTADADALIVPLYAAEPLPDALNARFDGQLQATLAAAQLAGKRKDLLAFPTFGRLPARWLVLTGLGERAHVDREAVRRAYGAAARQARDQGAKRLAVMLPDAAVATTQA